MNDFFVDLTNVSTEDVLPKGQYQVESINAELMATKSGSGSYLKVEFAVIDGQFRGWKLFDMFNVQNPNPQAVEIGHRNMKKLLEASGANSFVVQSPRQFIGLRASAAVDVKTDEYGTKNVIKSYSPFHNVQAAQQPRPTFQQQPQFQNQQNNGPRITTDDIPF